MDRAFAYALAADIGRGLNKLILGFLGAAVGVGVLIGALIVWLFHG